MQKIGVVGCGLMGAGIAEVCARAGLDVIVVESTDEFAAAGLKRVTSSINRAAEKGKITDAGEVLARISVGTELQALADRDLVIEAIREDEASKVELFRALDAIVSSSTVLASNTSSIPITKLGAVTSRPSHFLGIHFFNPATVLSLVEVIPGMLTDESVVASVSTWVEATLGKKAIRTKDQAGFVVNALLVPFLISAVRMLESGFAAAEDIDAGMVRGCAHPQGPLALADLIGLDTLKSVADSLYEEFRQPHYATPPLLARMVEAGMLGRKSGRGFYTYD